MLVAAAVAFGGRLDTVVNNAGWTHRNKPFLDVTEDEFDKVYAVNVKSVWLAGIAAVPQFRKQGGGSFVNIASTAGVRPRPGLCVYNSSKGAVINLSKGMAGELGPDGPLVVIHGGGKAVDVDLKRRQIEPKKVDGLRITDADTLESVIAVIGGVVLARRSHLPADEELRELEEQES